MNKRLFTDKELAIIACQITDLLNDQNQLSSTIKWSDVLENIDQYVIIPDENDFTKVIACARVRKMSYYLCEISHVSVHHEYQCRGHGKKILTLAEETAISIPGIQMLQSTVRLDNSASRSIFAKREWLEAKRFINQKTGNTVIVMIK
jgi:ribosomal protein S18 acetylase RimI-like enzyme